MQAGELSCLPFVYHNSIQRLTVSLHFFIFVENNALQYFWWFMLLAAFSGTSLSTAVINGFSEGIQIGSEVQEVIETIAVAIPSQVSATWLNWMIVRFTIVLPTQYLLQMNTFLFSWLGLKCCSRLVRGGGKLCGTRKENKLRSVSNFSRMHIQALEGLYLTEFTWTRPLSCFACLGWHQLLLLLQQLRSFTS
jgi:hypothetical protein